MCPSTKNTETFYRIFRDISTSVHSTTDVKEVLDLAVKKSTEALSAKGAILRILNLDTHQLELGAAYGLSNGYLSKGPVSSEKTITDLVHQYKVVKIQDVLGDPRVQYPQEAWEEGIRMILDVPLKLRNHIVGIIRVYFREVRDFSEGELDLVISIAEQCACSIDKARLIETQQSQYQHLALQTEKLTALGRMAAGIAHEINNPLTGILLYSTNLIKKVAEEGPLKEGLEVIIHETIRCRSIIQELLEFSREREPQKVLTNVNEVIEKSLIIMENEFRLHQIQLKKHLSTEIPDVLLDVNQMEQVFVNILINAVEAIQDRGAITVQSYMHSSQKFFRVEIADTGCGIAQEDLDKIFEPFFSTKEKGTGLGLAVSYGIVRGHQGSILVSSQPGSGTRFTIEIPLFNMDPSTQKEGQGNGSR